MLSIDPPFLFISVLRNNNLSTIKWISYDKPYWPEPQDGNSRKWTRDDPWERWIKNGCDITETDIAIEPEIQSFISQMLSFDPLQRPAIEDVQQFLLECIKSECTHSFAGVSGYINGSRQQYSDSTEQQGSVYLNSKFEALMNEFKN